MWKFDEDSDAVLNRENAIKIKAGFEELAYLLHGVTAIEVHIDPLKTSVGNADILLYAVFESRSAFEEFLRDPRRKSLKEFAEECTSDMLCMDFKG